MFELFSFYSFKLKDIEMMYLSSFQHYKLYNSTKKQENVLTLFQNEKDYAYTIMNKFDLDFLVRLQSSSSSPKRFWRRKWPHPKWFFSRNYNLSTWTSPSKSLIKCWLKCKTCCSILSLSPSKSSRSTRMKFCNTLTSKIGSRFTETSNGKSKFLIRYFVVMNSLYLYFFQKEDDMLFRFYFNFGSSLKQVMPKWSPNLGTTIFKSNSSARIAVWDCFSKTNPPFKNGCSSSIYTNWYFYKKNHESTPLERPSSYFHSNSNLADFNSR